MREKKKLFPKPQFTSSTNFMKIIRYNYFDMYKIGNFTFFSRCLLAFNTYCEWIYIWKCNTLFVITLEWTKIIYPENPFVFQKRHHDRGPQKSFGRFLNHRPSNYFRLKKGNRINIRSQILLIRRFCFLIPLIFVVVVKLS